MNCLCDNPILPLIILFSCCGKDDGIGGLFGCGSSSGNGLDQLLWLLCILCMCGNNGTSDRRY